MGHLFRMRHLARELRSRDLPFVFFVNDHAPSLQLLQQDQLPFETVDLNHVEQWAQAAIRRTQARLWINDRLNTSLAQAHAVKQTGIPLATFDDRGDGASLADLHIAALAFTADQPLGGRRVARGHEYLILNPEIAHFRRQRVKVERILVSMGGTDTYGATVKVVALLRRRGLGATVVIGPGFEHRAALDTELHAQFQLKVAVPSLIEEMSRHDMAVVGGGITAFEAATSGLPAIVVANEDFEIPVARYLASLGVARYAGHHSALNEAAFAIPEDVANMSMAGLDKVPLNGTEKVCQLIQELA
ncbi:glycosyl transferase [Bradyrhizobium sp.]|uniref:glycosyl transferase n=1 Tax=Bradyrhizobium sp. TaxID=376 RepID=UPI002605A276|nr:glycosyl transferase [Bradyrhizobium sp.]